MSNDDIIDLQALEVFDRSERGRRPGRTMRGESRSGHSSLLWMIRYELGRPASEADDANPLMEDGHPITKLQALAKRFVSIMLFGKDADALKAMQLYLAYTEGEPRQLVQFELTRVARSVAEQRNLDPQRLIERFNELTAVVG